MLQMRQAGIGRISVYFVVGAAISLGLAACSTVGPQTPGQVEATEFPKVGELPRDKPDQLLTPEEKDKKIQELLAKKKAQGA